MNGIFPHPWAVKLFITGITVFIVGYHGNTDTEKQREFGGACLIFGYLMILIGIWGW